MEQMQFGFGHDEISLQRMLSSMTGKMVSLTVTDNSTSMISVRRSHGDASIRLHRMFLSAGDDVMREMAEFIKKGRGRTPLIRDFIRRNRSLLTARPPRRQRVIHEGKYHNLLGISEAVNREYFDGRISACITWGRRCPKYACRKRTLGSYSRHSNTIRINPLLDSKSVPRYVITFIVYHEMLHADLEMREKNGRRVIHSKEFRQRERLYRDFGKATVWEKTYL